MGNAEELLSINNPDVLSKLHTSLSGLSIKEAEKRLEIYGANEFAKKEKRSPIIHFLSYFKSPLLLILLIAALIAGFLGEIINSIIILAIILLSVILDFYQEAKAERAVELLNEKITTTATIIRGNIKQEVKITGIVPGDILFLSAGDIVPADARIIEAKDLFVNQSPLTGESFPVEKSAAPAKNKISLITDYENYLLMGTSIVSGAATAVVISTGTNAEYGKIAKIVAIKEPETEFEQGRRNFGLLIMKATFFLVLFVFAINAFYKRDVLESLLFALALAVGLTPELLPMIISVNLSKGALKMSKKGVIVKRLASIQNFGSMDVLCADKTGTLTENKIKLILHVNSEGKNDEKVLHHSFLNSYYETGLKSPLDDAIMKYKHISTSQYKKIDEIPFDFTRKRISVVVENKKGRFLITKGAPEEILKECSSFELSGKSFPLTERQLKKIEKIYAKLSCDGFRVLGVACKKVQGRKKEYSAADERNLIFSGFIAFLDPPKETAKEALKLLKQSGIELKILTGDNELVTKKICSEIDFKIKGIVSGKDVDGFSDNELVNIAENANIFFRVTPEQKNRILLALKKNKHVIGFLGDGINDAPSLKSADIGISVDTAVDVAKESADILISGKSLRVLHAGVLEGRKTFSNTLKYIMMGTSSNFGNMVSLAGASLFMPFLPMLPRQILLNNFLYDFSESTIPSDEVDAVYLKKPRKLDISLIKKFMLYMGPISSIFDFLTFFALLYIFKANMALFQTGWFIESLFTQVLVIFVIRTNITPFYKSKPSRLLLLSSLSVLAVALIIPFTAFGRLFGFTDEIPLLFFIFLIGTVIVYLAIVEFVKTMFYKFYKL